MLREMTASNYNFFLDEIIRRRNIAIITRLTNEGKFPFNGKFM